MMSVQRLFQKTFFRLRALAAALVSSPVRRLFWSLQGMRIGRSIKLPRLAVTWPHQVSLGDCCTLESLVHFKFDGIWSHGPCIEIGRHCFLGMACEFNIRRGIRVGDHSAIASGCKFIDHDHGITGERLDESPGKEAAICLGQHVWLGANVVVLKGVTIGDSAVVGAGSVVTKSIPTGEIWAGIPAVKIGTRPA